MKFGVCYYPEHWPVERWPVDARLMRQAGISYVRIAEFAWKLMEPNEKVFSWGWLDRAINTLAAENLKVILGTPTATPPAWLCKAYPEILPVDVEGRVRRFGSRRHYCATSPMYRRHTARIVTALAERYGEHPAVVGWQIDNEFGCHDTARCYCDACVRAFRKWLQAHYGSLEALNAAWGTVFWSQAYGEWDEINAPNLTVTEANPSHVLDYWRFSADAYVDYQNLQFRILREYSAPGKFVTTNFMGGFSDLNYHDLARQLDFVTWDSYPTGHLELQDSDLAASSALYFPGEPRERFAYDTGDPYVTGFYHDLMRGLKNAPFWVMEQQCGHINWAAYNTGVRGRTPRLWTWHAAACGADTVVYFRWRACLLAQEQHHSGLLQHNGAFDVGYSDLLALKEDMPDLLTLTRAPVKSEVALLVDYDTLWALQLQPHRQDFSLMKYLFVFYRALQRLGIPVDIVPYDADLDDYKLVIAPSLFLGHDRLAATLTTYVKNGGTLLLGVRAGFKTCSNLVSDHALPGPFRYLVGATITGWHALPPDTSYAFRTVVRDLDGRAAVWAESLAASNPDVHVLAEYVSGPFQGRAAFTERILELGRVLYLGWYPTVLQAQTLVYRLAEQLKLTRIADLPRGVIARQRGDYTVLLNFTDAPLTATVCNELIPVSARNVVMLNPDELCSE